MNLFRIAEENTDYLLNKYALLRGKYTRENNLHLVTHFLKLVKDQWNLSINLKIHDLNLFFIEGKYKNKYDLEKETKDYSKLKYLNNSKKSTIKKKELNKKRDIFDNSFNSGRKNKYLSLNIGGLGIKKYGNFCLIIKRNHTQKYKSLAFIKEDSLNYVNYDKINIEKLKKEISNRNYVHLLAVLKHEDDICPEFIERCANLICCSENYIEAITQEKVHTSHIECVRINRDEYNSYFLLNFYTENKYKFAFERIRSYMFLGVIKLLKKHNIKLEKVVEDGN